MGRKGLNRRDFESLLKCKQKIKGHEISERKRRWKKQAEKGNLEGEETGKTVSSESEEKILHPETIKECNERQTEYKALSNKKVR